MKTGRNDPCPCGSGKKFKRCCEQTQLTSGDDPVKEWLHRMRDMALTDDQVELVALIPLHIKQAIEMYRSRGEMVTGVNLTWMIEHPLECAYCGAPILNKQCRMQFLGDPTLGVFAPTLLCSVCRNHKDALGVTARKLFGDKAPPVRLME